MVVWAVELTSALDCIYIFFWMPGMVGMGHEPCRWRSGARFACECRAED